MKRTKQEKELIRILSTDIPADMYVWVGLTKIKGIGFSMANAICKALDISTKKKMKELNEEELKRLEEFIKKPTLPNFLFNRRKDRESGENTHLIGSDLDLRKEFDIRRLKKIKSYRGIRHALGLPVRGQRTKAHFRSKGKTLGVRREKGRMKK